jgi:hypothetical protein
MNKLKFDVMKILYQQLIIFCFTWALIPKLHAQENMFVTLHDGTVLEFSINEIESLTFDIQTNLALQNEIMTKFFEAKVYPNPAGNHVNIHYTLAGEGKVILEMFNSDGRRITGYSPGRLSMGEYNYRWETSNFPPGMYILRIKQNNSLVTEKIIINR